MLFLRANWYFQNSLEEMDFPKSGLSELKTPTPKHCAKDINSQ